MINRLITAITCKKYFYVIENLLDFALGLAEAWPAFLGFQFC